MQQRASISRAYLCKTGINRELISSFKAYARLKKKSLYSEKKKAYWVRPYEFEIIWMGFV